MSSRKVLQVHARNVFDQYELPENRLTHALVHALGSDEQLTGKFVKFATDVLPPRGAALSLACQRLPGEFTEVSEEGAEQRGIPDAWIYDEEKEWAVVLESKITAGLTSDQINGHLVTARKRGFSKVQVLAVTLEAPTTVRQRFSNTNVKWKTWPEVFEFFHQHQDNPRVREFIEYMLVLEGQLMSEISQPLTKFMGIPFDSDHPFNEHQAKVVLRGLMRELRPKLATILPINISARSKPLTGAWDVVHYKSPSRDDKFNLHPHLTVGIEKDHSLIQLTLPHKAKSTYWNQLRAASKKEMQDALALAASRVSRSFLERNIWEPQFTFKILQRHFYAQRQAVTDGSMQFDIDAVIPNYTKGTGVKHVPAWLDAIYEILVRGARKGVNFEVAIAARFPYLHNSVSHGSDFAAALAVCAQAFEPFRHLLIGQSSK